MTLNKALLLKQGIDKETEALLEDEYNFLDSVLREPEYYTDPVAEIEKREFNLQRLWGFPQDRNYHRYWAHIKGCTCKLHQMDNADRWGTPYRVISQSCHWHGDKQ